MGFDHFCNCLCAPWQEGFSIANNHRAWHSIGVVPFSRKVYWELVEKERARDKTCAKVDLDASKLNVQDMVQTMFGTDNREEVVDPTTQTTRLTSSMLWDKGPITFDVTPPGLSLHTQKYCVPLWQSNLESPTPRPK